VYTFTKQTTDTETITIQQPSSGSKLVQLKGASVHCSAACTIEQFRNGTAASSTGGTIARGNPDNSVAPTVGVYYSSNTNTEAAQVLPVIDHSGGYDQAIPLENIYLSGDGGAKNYTIKVTITGTVRISLMWQEF
jgi:hypothetical protein